MDRVLTNCGITCPNYGARRAVTNFAPRGSCPRRAESDAKEVVIFFNMARPGFWECPERGAPVWPPDSRRVVNLRKSGTVTLGSIGKCGVAPALTWVTAAPATTPSIQAGAYLVACPGRPSLSDAFQIAGFFVAAS